MSRIGYSELAQWYMKKLAAEKGGFYVLSANTLLDLACDDNYDNSYSYGEVPRPLHVRGQDDAEQFVEQQQVEATSYWPVQELQV